MVFLITGTSHTGKTLFSQKLIEKYKYQCLSLDHLKMGLIRSGQTNISVLDDDKLTDYIWSIVKEIIKTAIENKQNLIIEGLYIPFDYINDFEDEYLAFIKSVCLIFSTEYIENNYYNIIKYGNVVESRLDNTYSKELMIKDNKRMLEACKKHNFEYYLIDKEFNLNYDFDVVLTTNRLILRLMTHNDFDDICKIIQDVDVMYAYEHAFSDLEVKQWIDNQINRYKENGFGLWAVILKDTNELIGQCGITMQSYNDKEVMEIGYLFQKKFWRNGYATEACISCKKYAFEKLNAKEIYSIIRDTNIASQNVAKYNGMIKIDEIVKYYHNVYMPHFIYKCEKI